MRTYFIHGKITPTSFHLTATLNRNPPKGYYFINVEQAETISDAVRIIVKGLSLDPPGPKTTDGIQTSFQ